MHQHFDIDRTVQTAGAIELVIESIMLRRHPESKGLT